MVSWYTERKRHYPRALRRVLEHFLDGPLSPRQLADKSDMPLRLSSAWCSQIWRRGLLLRSDAHWRERPRIYWLSAVGTEYVRFLREQDPRLDVPADDELAQVPEVDDDYLPD